MSLVLTYTDDHALAPLEWHRRTREWCREMRATQPIMYDSEYGWLILRYKEVVQVLTDYATYSSEYEMPEQVPEESRSIIMMDPPRHRQMRSLVTQAFSARTIAQMEPVIENIAHDLLANISASGHADFMDELAVPLPVMVIAEILGLPREDWRLFKKWTDVQVNRASEQEAVAVQKELSSYFFSFLDERRKHPDDRIVSLLLAAEVEGKRLTDEELYAFFLTLLVAGNVTTTNLLGNAMLCFHLFPEALQKLQKNPQMVQSTVEEILRYMGPGRAFTHDPVGSRFARKDVEIEGHHIRKGEIVRPITFSANFDEQQFEHPEQLDIERNPNRHLGFGHGIHFCLGAPLARLEARIVLAEMLKRFSHWEVLDADRLEQINTVLIFGVKHLPMNFQNV
ncbi:MAG: cytochrome P450 [Ktedonobacteraceae bacterium]|nr:cytochrome P450 [Ktedonobacteraceae bacterium]